MKKKKDNTVAKCLIIDQKKRPSVKELLNHESLCDVNAFDFVYNVFCFYLL